MSSSWHSLDTDETTLTVIYNTTYLVLTACKTSDSAGRPEEGIRDGGAEELPRHGRGGFQAGARLNCILKKGDLVREECSRKEEFFEQRSGARTPVAGLLGSNVED